MGLITGLLTLPIAPVRGVAWVAEQIRQQAERDFYDPAAVQEELAELDVTRELGMIDEDEAKQLEYALLARLMEPQAGNGEASDG